MNLVYLRMMFFSVRMKSDVGSVPAAAAAAETGRFEPMAPPALLQGDPDP